MSLRALPLLVLAFVVACGTESTPTPVPTDVPGLTATPLPTALPTLAPSATPTPTPEPVETQVPSGPPAIPDSGIVRIANFDFIVDIADDDGERTLGLSGRESLDIDGGMWFDREEDVIGSFWMRGMLFPIDIVWISSNLRVVDITHSAAVPPPNASLEELERYSPSRPARYVLEINAGMAESLGIEVGTHVEFSRF